MKRIVVVFSVLLLISCQSNHNKSYRAKVVTINGAECVVCEEDSLGDEICVNLSELVDSLQIIRFENRDSAFFKFYWITISEHYIGIIQSLKACKLFDKQGHFLCDIGAIGQGPGEYLDVSDLVIGEKEEIIYLTPLYGSKSILKYNFQGDFIGDINIDNELFMPRVYLQNDSVISLVHFCFRDNGGSFVGANISRYNNNIIDYVYYNPLVLNLNEGNERRAGMENMIWSNRNTQGFPFKSTVSDTLYHYDDNTNKISPVFTLDMNTVKKGESWFIFSELPYHYTVFIKDKGEIIIDKSSKEAFYFKLKNDFFGNNDLPSPYVFRDGYFYKIYEPAELKEEIQTSLSLGQCPKNKRSYLEELLSSLHEEDNNIMLLGKLKK